MKAVTTFFRSALDITVTCYEKGAVYVKCPRMDFLSKYDKLTNG